MASFCFRFSLLWSIFHILARNKNVDHIMSLSGWKLFDRLWENLKFCLGLRVPKQLAFCPCLEPHLHSTLHILTTGEGQSCLNVNLAGFFFQLRVLGFIVFSIWNLFSLVIYKADSSLFFRSQCKIISSRRPFLTSLPKVSLHIFIPHPITFPSIFPWS